MLNEKQIRKHFHFLPMYTVKFQKNLNEIVLNKNQNKLIEIIWLLF